MPERAALPANTASQPARALLASNAEQRHSSYVLQLPSSNFTTLNKPTAAMSNRQQQQQLMKGAGVLSTLSATPAAAADEQQQLEESLSPDAPGSPQPGQALLGTEWGYDDDQQQQVSTAAPAALHLLQLHAETAMLTESVCRRLDHWLITSSAVARDS
jgi:hypothetical protein